MGEVKTQYAGGGIGFSGALFLLFLTLKLLGVIGWSWWWVFAPLWGPVALIFGLVALVLLCVGVARTFRGRGG